MNQESKLAILGGPKTIVKGGPHYIWPIINKDIEQNVLRQLHKSISIYDRSGIFEDFENTFANYHGRKFALLCSSGTLAIHSMFVAAGFKYGDEVICPAYTFFASVTPLLFTGAKPVLCDCDVNGNIDPEEIKKKITNKTKGVVVTHMWGIPCQMAEIIKICKEKKLLLLEDCSHAHGAKYNNKPLGSFGDLAAWSLQGPKNVTGGEGGIVVSNNEEFYYRMLLLGHYNKRCKQEIPKNHNLYKFFTTGMGMKYRAHPLAVSIALEIFKNLDNYRECRNIFANKIMEALPKNGGLLSPKIMEGSVPSWYGLVFQYKKEKFDGLSIERFFCAIQEEGLIEVDRPGSTSPLNLLPLFQDPTQLFPIYQNNHFSYKPGDFPRAEDFYNNAIKIPVWATDADESMVNSYINGLLKVIYNFKKLL